MTIQREMFVKEYQIAKQNNNVEFMEWLDELMCRADEQIIGEI